MKKFLLECEAFLEKGGIVKEIVLLIISAVSVVLSFIFSQTGPALPFDVAWIAIVLCGLPIICEAILGLLIRFDVKADVLVSIAIVASVCIGEIFAAGEVAFIMQLGALLEDLTVRKAHAGIEKLVKLTPVSARIISDGKEITVKSEEVCKNDIVRVNPGETVPVDGVIISGSTSINQAVVTGESMPVDKGVGDEVYSGTVNNFGSFDMRAEKVGEDSSVQRMIRLVRSADAQKAKIVGLADKWATWIVVAALLSAVITWIISGQIIRAVTILVVFCPCALVLATPTAIMATIGNVTKKGFLVKEGDALERLAKIRTIAFDKTGTLTKGVLTVTECKAIGDKFDDERIFALVASAESKSEHPLGKAIVKSYKKPIAECLDFEMVPGKGVQAVCDGKTVTAGSVRFLHERSVPVRDEQTTFAEKFTNQGKAVVFVAIDGVLSGYVVLSDILRENCKETIDAIKETGVNPVLLTGDNVRAASFIASSAGIADFKAELLPEDKLAEIDKAEKSGNFVCMVGDGVNDAPALKCAHVGIAMSETGSDIAVEAADIALVGDRINEIPHLIAISKRMMTTIKLNLIFSMTLNFIAVFLAITGFLGPVVGALVHNAGSVLVIANSALLLGWKKRKKSVRHK